jgi:hypothetical protein
MFLAGLKFALGLAVGAVLLSGVAMLGIIGTELFDRWRKKRQHVLWKAKTRVQRGAMPQFRERAVFQFCYRSDDWIPTPDKSEYLQ